MAALEFCLPAEDAARLLRLPLFSARRRRPVSGERIWYDTADGALGSAGMSLCEDLCKDRGAWRVEASQPGRGQVWPPGTPAPVMAEAPSLEQLADGDLRLPGPLMPLAGFRGRQFVLPLRDAPTEAEPDGTDAAAEPREAASITVIEGALRGVTQERAICRVVMRGSRTRLMALSTAVAQAVRLTAPRWSLASEAIGLARGQTPPARRTGGPDITPGTTLSDAVAIVFGHLADVILSFSATAAEGQGPEPVHGMRVAVRRLRSALSVFKRAASGPTFDAARDGLKHLAAVLGAARDWDVFLDGTGAAVSAAMPDDARIGAMLAAGTRRRALAYADLRRLLDSAEFRQLELALVQLAALRPWENDADPDHAERLRADTLDYAGGLLDRRLEHMLSPGADLSVLDVGALHAIRKQGKQLRYACEFFAPLYGRKAAKPFIARLSVLQEALGHLNDTASAAKLMAAFGTGADRQFAAGAVQGYVAARAGATRRDIERAWSKFRRQAPFWV